MLYNKEPRIDPCGTPPPPKKKKKKNKKTKKKNSFSQEQYVDYIFVLCFLFLK